MRKQNVGGGNGVSGLVFVDGVQVDQAAIAFDDATGVDRLVIETVAVGTIIDLALSPVGADGVSADGSDGAYNRLTIIDNPPIADSYYQWQWDPGVQGANGWTWGYYNRTADGDATYALGDFTAFADTEWDAAAGQYYLIPRNPPWTTIGSQYTHPNSTANGGEYWTIRRWECDADYGEVAVRWTMRKDNVGCGDGVAGSLFLNGELLDAATIAYNDNTGVNRVVCDLELKTGDILDLALGPNAPDNDGCDGSVNRLRVETEQPDADGDGVSDCRDNCVMTPNPDQEDADSDGVGDVCDNCVDAANADQADRNLDGSGDACEAPWIADSYFQFSLTGTQGENGWFNGYYNLTADQTNEDGVYQAEDFTEFTLDAWRGAGWRIAPSGAPWTTINQGDVHPNGTNSAPNEEHWVIRRWVSDRTAKVELTWHMRKTNLNPTGVSGRLFLNGTQIDSATIHGRDGLGVLRTQIVDIAVDDKIDLALTPVGVCGDTADGSDGSFNYLTIRELPAAGAVSYANVADSMADWSATGTQGENGWSYGYYDVREDVTNGDGAYQTGEFIPFTNDGTGDPVSPDGNHWTGSKWDLITDASPWTELTCSTGHPAAGGAGTAVHWAVRRWTSDVDGDVEIHGFFYNAGGGDGTVERVFLNGTQLFAQVTDGHLVPFTIRTTIASGDILDFAIDPDGAGNLAKSGIDAVTDGSDTTDYVILVSLLEPAEVGPRFIRGDTDGNGIYTLGDGIQVLERLFADREAFTSDCEDAGDLDDNGIFTIGDAVWLFNYLFAEGELKKPPFPPADTCGPDETPETTLGCNKFDFCK
ncbi:MAG: hypothetical protein JXP34_16705 [Planctomycetes bacterium]|nr:hypothetical protein [Planctomycetota bacterium]